MSTWKWDSFVIFRIYVSFGAIPAVIETFGEFETTNFQLSQSSIEKLNFNLSLNPNYCQTKVTGSFISWCSSSFIFFFVKPTFFKVFQSSSSDFRICKSVSFP